MNASLKALLDQAAAPGQPEPSAIQPLTTQIAPPEVKSAPITQPAPELNTGDPFEPTDADKEREAMQARNPDIQAFVEQAINEKVDDHKFDPIAFGYQSKADPDAYELAQKVWEKREAQGWKDKTGRAFANAPQTVKGAATHFGNFLKGIPYSLYHGGQQLGAAIVDDPNAATKTAETVIGAQKAEQNFKSFVEAITGPDIDVLNGYADGRLKNGEQYDPAALDAYGRRVGEFTGNVRKAMLKAHEAYNNRSAFSMSGGGIAGGGLFGGAGNNEMLIPSEEEAHKIADQGNMALNSAIVKLRKGEQLTPQEQAWLDKLVYTSDAIDSNAPEMQPIVKRAKFDHYVNELGKLQQLNEGKPLDTGVVADYITWKGDGLKPSETLGPDNLARMGADPVDNEATEMLGAAADPNNLLLMRAPSVPGAGRVGGAMVQAVAKPLAGAAKLAEKIPQKFGAGLALFQIASGDYAKAAWTATAMAGKYGLEKIGALAKSVDEFGRMARTGGKFVPAANKALADARLTGQSAKKAWLENLVGNTAVATAAMPVGMAGFNAVSAGALPGGADFNLESFIGMQLASPIYGLLAGTNGIKPQLVEAIRPQLREQGQARLSMDDSPEGQRSAEFIAKLPEAERNAIYETAALFQGLEGENAEGNAAKTQIYVLSNADFQQVGGDTSRGFITKGGKVFVNGENPSNQGGEMSHTLGHEAGGHGAINMLRAMTGRGGNLYGKLVEQMRKELGSTGKDGTWKPSKEFSQFVEAYNKALPADAKKVVPGDATSFEEFLSETAGQVIATKGTASLVIPDGVRDKMERGAAQVFAKMFGMDINRMGGDAKFDRTESAAINSAFMDAMTRIADIRFRPQEADDIEYEAPLAEAAAAPAPAAKPPGAKVQRTPHQVGAIAALRSIGFSAKAAREKVDAAQGSTIEEIVQNVLSGVNPQAPAAPAAAPATPAEAVAPNPAVPDPSKPLAPAAEAPAAAPQPSQAPAEPAKAAGEAPVSAATPAVEAPKGPLATATAVEAPVAAVAAPEKSAEQLSREALDKSKDEINAQLGKAPLAPAAPARKTAAEITPLADQAVAQLEAGKGWNRVKDKEKAKKVARVRAILDVAAQENGGDGDLLQARTDADGKVTYSGRLDPSIESHRVLMDEAMTPEGQTILDELQNRRGETVFVDYRSAEKQVQGEVYGMDNNIDRTGEQRKEEYVANSPDDRRADKDSGSVQKKAVHILGTRVNPTTGSVTVLGFSPDKLLSNAGKLLKFAQEQKIEVGYKDINDPELVQDMQRYAENHANGYKGDGSGPVTGVEANPNFQPHEIAPEKFYLLNAAFGNEVATKTGSKKLETRARAQEAQLRAVENDRPLAPSGDPNPLRDAINATGKFEFTNQASGETRRGTGQMLEQVYEHLAPDLIQKVSPEKPPGEHTIRPVGFKGQPGEVTGRGIPKSDYVASGFMPTEDATRTPKYKSLWFERGGKLRGAIREQAHKELLKPNENEKNFLRARVTGEKLYLEGTNSSITPAQRKAAQAFADEHGLEIQTNNDARRIDYMPDEDKPLSGFKSEEEETGKTPSAAGPDASRNRSELSGFSLDPDKPKTKRELINEAFEKFERKEITREELANAIRDNTENFMPTEFNENEIRKVTPKIAELAQQIYDSWKQDSEGVDEEFGTGGICDAIAAEMSSVLSEQGWHVSEGGQPGDDHAYIVVTDGKKAYEIDIPPHVYESGGGYSWKKKEGVQFSADDVTVNEVPLEAVDPDLLADLTGEDVGYMPDDKKNLVALHNVDTESLKKALRLGGLAVPSIGITRKDNAHTGFGDITLIMKPDAVDPQKDSRNRTFTADAYSGRHPQPIHDVDKKRLNGLVKELTKLRGDWYAVGAESPYELAEWVKVGKEGNFSKAYSEAHNSNLFKALFYEEHSGKKLEKKMRPERLRSGLFKNDELREMAKTIPIPESDSYSELGKDETFIANLKKLIEESSGAKEMDDPELAKYLRDASMKYYFDEDDGSIHWARAVEVVGDLHRIQSGREEVDTDTPRDMFREYAKEHQEAFDNWLDKKLKPAFGHARVKVGGKLRDYTLNNVVEAMTTGGPRGKEKTLAKGLGFSRSMGAKELKTFDQMHKRKHMLVDEETEDKAREELQAKFHKLADAVAPAHYSEGKGFSFDRLDDTSMALGHYLKKPGGIPAMRAAMRKNNFDHLDKLTQSDFEEMIAIAEELRDSPTKYFETKPQRAVEFDEVAAAIVPEGTPEELIGELKARGIKVETYSKGKTQADYYTERKQKVQAVSEREGALFMPDDGSAPKLSDEDKARIEELRQIEKDADTKLQSVSAFDSLPDGWASDASFDVHKHIREFDETPERAELKRKREEAQIERMKIESKALPPPKPDPSIYRSGGFYSTLEKIAKDKIKGAATAEQIEATLKNNGVKKDELEWVLGDYLAENKGKKIKPEELQAAIDLNKVRLQETVLGGGDRGYVDPGSIRVGVDDFTWTVNNNEGTVTGRHPEEYDTTFLIRPVTEQEKEDGDYSSDYILKGDWGDPFEVDSIDEGKDRAADYVLANLQDRVREDNRELERDGIDKTKFGEYAFPGGSNYREILFALQPRKKYLAKAFQDENGKWNVRVGPGENDILWIGEENEVRAQAKAAIENNRKTGEDFDESHWDEKNVVFHTRVSDRTLESGDDTLLADEIQSDWHQKGRERGYKNKADEKASAEAGEKISKIDNKLHAIWRKVFPNGTQTVGAYNIANVLERNALPEYKDLKLGVPHEEIAALAKEARALTLEASAIRDTMPKFSNAVPDAPLKGEGWKKLALKQLLAKAVDEGKDSLSWTEGQYHAQRYDLSRQISKVEFIPDTYRGETDWENGRLVAYDKRHNRVVDEGNTSIDGFAEYIGDGPAQKLKDAIASKKYDREQWSIEQDGDKWNIISPDGDHSYGFGGDLLAFDSKEEASAYLDSMLSNDRENIPSIDGLDLKIGGEGMIGFYDKELVNMANDLGKKYGAKVTRDVIKGIRHDLKAGEVVEGQPKSEKERVEVWKLPLTDKLRQAIAGGQSLFMPDEGSSRNRSFYSALEKVAKDKVKGVATTEQILATLRNNGVKQDEINWVLGSFLKEKSGQKVKPEELMQAIEANKVQLEEVAKGGEPSYDDLQAKAQEIMDIYIDEEMDGMNLSSYEVETNLRDGDDGDGEVENYVVTENGYPLDGETYLDEDAAQKRAEKLAKDAEGEMRTDISNRMDWDKMLDEAKEELMKGKETNWEGEDTTLPGGQNYRELNYVLPKKKPSEAEIEKLARERYGKEISELSYSELNDINGGSEVNYKVPSAHRYGDKADTNRVFHMRVDDRILAGGKKLLFSQEFQSDWHQEGREKGYKGDMEPLRDKYQEELKKAKELGYEVEDTGMPTRFIKDKDGTAVAMLKRGESTADIPELQPLVDAYEAAISNVHAIPDAPFKGNLWKSLAIKHLIIKGVQEGKDLVGWTTGKMQAERYKLSKHVDEVVAFKDDKGYVINAGSPVNEGEPIPADKLKDWVGVELANKIISETGEQHPDYPRAKVYKGLDLDVGGEGMKGFYDKEIVNLANDIVKKYGAKVEKAKLPLDHSQDAVSGEMVMNKLGIPQREQAAYWRALSIPERRRLMDEMRNETAEEIWVLPITDALKKFVEQGMPMFMPNDKGKPSLRRERSTPLRDPKPAGPAPLSDFRFQLDDDEKEQKLPLAP